MEDAIESPLRRSSSVDRESEQELAWIDATRRGDPAAFNRLVLKRERQIYNLVFRMLGNRDDAAEMTQEIFLAVFRNITRFERKARFSTWLYRIAVNHCLSRLRRRPPLIQTLDDEAEYSIPVRERLGIPDRQDERILRLEQRRIVRDALARLTPEQRVVVELKFFQEETFLSISHILSVPESTVKSRFYAALDALKGRLGALE
ncbi:MAG: sigma-70 family RNA polymerase sigma factor [Acidobacteriota bacterium]|jgi:RNA polymerase sigma-70 factor (ECF subfamily)